MTETIKVPNHIIESARMAQKSILKAKDRIKHIESWLEDHGVDIDLMRNEDVILPHIEHAEYSIENFQKDIEEFIKKFGVQDSLVGKRFGKLTVLCESERSGYYRYFSCVCDCGEKLEVRHDSLVGNNTTSCGCYMVENGQRLFKYTERKFKKDGVYTNLLKSKLRTDNSTGVKGVYVKRLKSGKIMYAATISVKGKRYYLGSYESVESAKEARKLAEEKLHKPYLDT